MAIFGKATFGATGFDMGNAGVYVCRFTAPENGTVTKLTMDLHWGEFPRSFIPVIYDDLNGRPNNLLAIGPPVTQTSDTQYTPLDLPIFCQVVVGQKIHIGVCAENSCWSSYDNGEDYQTNLDGVDVYPNPNNSFGIPRNSWNDTLFVYATYTPSAPSTPYNVTINAYCNTNGVAIAVPITMNGSPTGYSTPTEFTGLTGSHTFTVPATDAHGHPFKQWNTGETSSTITINAEGTHTAYYQTSEPPPAGEVFHNCNQLTTMFQGRTADWLSNGTAPYAEVTVVNNGDILPDGTVATTIEGGKCLMLRSGKMTNGIRQCCNFFATLLNPNGDWNFTDKELMKIRLLTNHPEYPIYIELIISDWIVHQVNILPAGSLVAGQWTEILADLRISPQGSPDLTMGKAINVSATDFPEADEQYYVLIDFITVEKATGQLPPIEVSISPTQAIINLYGAQQFTASPIYGTQPITIEWFLNGQSVGMGLTYNFVGTSLGTFTLYAVATDGQEAQATSNTAIITVREAPPVAGKLRIEGRFIKDLARNTVLLRGVHDHGFVNSPYGHWMGADGTVYWSTWNPAIVAEELDGMKVRGINVFRIHDTIEYWINNTNGHRQMIKDLLSMAKERGIYIILDFYCVRANPSSQPNLPYPPYSLSGDSVVITNAQAFVNLWGNVATELRTYDNVIFDLWNEPIGPDDAAMQSWFNTVQQCIQTIRGVTDHIIMVQWDYQAWVNIDYNDGSKMDWVYDSRLQGTNILFSTHQYENSAHRTSGNCYTMEDLRLYYQMSLIDQMLNDGKPLIIGEASRPGGNANMLTALQNTLALMNEKGISFVGFWWWHELAYALLTGGANYQTTPTGQAVLDALTVPPPPPEKQYLTIVAINGQTNPAAGTYEFDKNSLVTITATPNSGYRFKEWLLDNVSAGTSPSIVIAMDANHTVVAIFEVVPAPVQAGIPVWVIPVALLGAGVLYLATKKK